MQPAVRNCAPFALLGSSRHRSNIENISIIVNKVGGVKQTGIVGEHKLSVVSKDPLLLGVLVALPDNNWVGGVDWHEEHIMSPQLNQFQRLT